MIRPMATRENGSIGTVQRRVVQCWTEPQLPVSLSAGENMPVIDTRNHQQHSLGLRKPAHSVCIATIAEATKTPEGKLEEGEEEEEPSLQVWKSAKREEDFETRTFRQKTCKMLR